MDPTKELLFKIVASFDKGDFRDARAVGEQLLSVLSVQSPTNDHVRAMAHFLVANAIASMRGPSIADMQAACSHLREALKGPLPSDQRTNAFLALGQALIKASDRDGTAFQEAVDAFRAALALLVGDANGEIQAAAHFGIAEAYERLGPISLEAQEEALKEYHAAYECYDPKTSPVNRATVAYHIGQMLLQLAGGTRDTARRGEAVPFLEEAHLTYAASGLDQQAADASRLLEQAGCPEPPQATHERESAGSLGDGQLAAEAQASSEMPAELRAEAISMIRSPATRPVLLKNWIAMHQPADAERLGFLRRFIVEPGMSEVDAAQREAETRNDPELRAQAEQMSLDLLQYAQMLIKRDRDNSTHQRAIDILRSHLNGGPGFLLFLRNFNLEVVKSRGPRWLAGVQPTGAKVKFVNVLDSDSQNKLGRFADAFPASLPIVAISDVGDVLAEQSGRIAKLRVLSSEWDLVAGMLIGEAIAIVFFLDSISGGSKRELDLIADQSAAQRTTVVLMKPGWDEMDRRLLGVSDDAGQLEFRVLPEALKKRFGEQLVQIANFPSDQDATRTIVDAILKRLVV